MSRHSKILAILVLLSSPLSAEEQRPEPYTVTISGGISLGAYEAGLNWLLIKDLRTSLGSERPRHLASVTGASAGSINALLTAATWCSKVEEPGVGIPDEVADNLFRDVWLNIDFSSLLPGHGAEIDLSRYEDPGMGPSAPVDSVWDALLSRQGIKKDIVESLQGRVDGDHFRSGCRMPMGLAVTRAEAVEIPFGGDSIQLPVQTHHVSLAVEAAEGGGLRFLRVQPPVDPRKELSPDGVPMVVPVGPDGKLPFELVVRYLMASSAFPVAFGRVALPHCVPTDWEMHRPFAMLEKPAHLDCPEGWTMVLEPFVDGGVFDNVPIGLAVELAGNGDELRIFYMDPDVRTEDVDHLTESQRWERDCWDILHNAQHCTPRREPMTFGLAEQLGFLGSAVSVARTHILADAMAEVCQANGPRRRLVGETAEDCQDRMVITRRRLNITGEMLGAFAAFYAYGFREYDYYVGVYDGIESLAQDRCRGAVASGCLDEEIDTIADSVGITITPEPGLATGVPDRMLSLFDRHRREGVAACGSLAALAGGDPHLDHLLAVHGALNCRPYASSPKEDFGLFVQHLKDQDFCAADSYPDDEDWAKDCRNPLLQEALADPESWYRLLALRSFGRLRNLEDQQYEALSSFAADERQRYARAAEAIAMDMGVSPEVLDEECDLTPERDTVRAFCHAREKARELAPSQGVRRALVWADILARSYIPTDPGFHLSPSANPTAYPLFPYALGLDGANGGMALQYRPVYRFENGNLMELPIIPFYKGFDADAENFTSVGIGFSDALPTWYLTSWDMGLHYIKDHGSRYGGDSLGVSIGGTFLLRRLRADVLYRPDYDGKELMVLISINDLPSLLPRRYADGD